MENLKKYLLLAVALAALFMLSTINRSTGAGKD